MAKKYTEPFYIDTYMFICGINELIRAICGELSHLCIHNYSDKFKSAIDGVNRLRYNIDKYLYLWDEDDDVGVNQTIRNLKEYCTYYRESLCDSTPSMCYSDASYIKDSLETSKIILFNKLNRLKEGLS
jgi:hypothetical protein